MITKIKATVIGWYGTETIGDRAILAGIIRLLSEVASDITIDLGSLYPILSERTLSDDGAFFEQCAHQSKLKITLFDSQKRRWTLNKCIWLDMPSPMHGGERKRPSCLAAGMAH